MSAVNPRWQDGFDRDVFRDCVSGRWWFRLTLISEAGNFEHESEVVYSSREDAEQAADDASEAACRYQAWAYDLWTRTAGKPAESSTTPAEPAPPLAEAVDQ